MKKVLALLLICLSSTALFAAGEHYKVVSTGCTNQTTKFNCVIVIDGEEQQNANLELAAFDQNGVCRAAKKAKLNTSNGRYVCQMQLKGNDGFVYSFRVYDHTIGDDLPLEADFHVEWEGEILTQLYFMGNVTIGSAADPRDAEFVTVSGIELPILGHTTDANGWYLISSPVGDVDVTAVTGLVNEDYDAYNYDLYSFDQAATNGLEWINQKGNANFTQLVAGKGYLYASPVDTTLVFPGEAYGEPVQIALTNAAEAQFAGWNLVGNPYNAETTFGDYAYYKMNPETHADLIAVDGGTPVGAMEGVFIHVDDAAVLALAPAQQGNKGATLALNLSNGRNVVDRAIVSFGQGGTLPKFQLNPNSTKVYFPVDNEDYAVVRSEGMGEMPVNFKAESNGTYSLSLSSENVEFSYLHLIDNLTGADQDLLADPSYSFEASVTDYASRFRLVFATGNAEDSFAFFSNGSLIVSNDGNATLQVVDVNGRIISSESINGSASVNVNAASGVYMVRLINGDNVKVQKVVVK